MAARRAWILTTVGLAFLQTGEAGAQTPDAQLSDAIASARLAIPAMAQEYGWPGEVPTIEGATLDATRSRISLSEAEIGRIVQGARSTIYSAVKLVVAHEVWHFVDLQRGTAKGTSGSDERRLYECRADLMAARYMTKKGGMLWEPNLLSNEAEQIAQVLWRSSSADHPTPRQRRRAARFGALSVLRENPQTSEADRALIASEVDYVEGDMLDGWTRHACRMIVQFGRPALSSIVVQPPAVAIQDDRTTASFVYVNPTPRAIEIATIIRANHSIPEPSDPNRLQYQNWHFPRVVRIDAWCRAPVTLQLPGKLDRPQLYFSNALDDDDVLVTARFIEGSAPPALPPLGPNRTPEDDRLGSALQRLANDALNGFANNRSGGGRLERDSLWFKSLVSIPGPNDNVTSIILKRDGAASVVRTLYSGPSREEAASRYAAFESALRRLWPTLAMSSPEEAGESSRFTAPVGRFARVEISLFPSGVAGYTVYFMMQPNPLGLVDDATNGCTADTASPADGRQTRRPLP